MSWWSSAVIEVVLAGALAGLVGVQVVLRRLSFFTMALTHATFPGVVLAAILGIDILVGGAVAGGLVALGVAVLTRRRGQDAAAATGVLLSAGFALGAGLIATQSGFRRDLSSFLVGSILTVESRELVITAVALVVVAVVLLAGSRPLTVIGFDRTGARAAGLPVGAWDVALLLTVELVVVTLVPAVGTILAVSLIVAPAAAARLWSDRVPVITALAVSLAVASGLAGLYISSHWNVAAGAAISLSATAALAVSWILRRPIRTTAPLPGKPGRAAHPAARTQKW